MFTHPLRVSYSHDGWLDLKGIMGLHFLNPRPSASQSLVVFKVWRAYAEKSNDVGQKVAVHNIIFGSGRMGAFFKHFGSWLEFKLSQHRHEYTSKNSGSMRDSKCYWCLWIVLFTPILDIYIFVYSNICLLPDKVSAGLSGLAGWKENPLYPHRYILKAGGENFSWNGSSLLRRSEGKVNTKPLQAICFILCSGIPVLMAAVCPEWQWAELFCSASYGCETYARVVPVARFHLTGTPLWGIVERHLRPHFSTSLNKTPKKDGISHEERRRVPQTESPKSWSMCEREENEMVAALAALGNPTHY